MLGRICSRCGYCSRDYRLGAIVVTNTGVCNRECRKALDVDQRVRE